MRIACPTARADSRSVASSSRSSYYADVIFVTLDFNLPFDEPAAWERH